MKYTCIYRLESVKMELYLILSEEDEKEFEEIHKMG